jgi:hypothetical protein
MTFRLSNSIFSNENLSLKQKIEIAFKNFFYLWWILLGEKNSDKFIGKFNMICKKKNDYKIVFNFFMKFLKYKIFLISEEFIDFETGSDFF